MEKHPNAQLPPLTEWLEEKILLKNNILPLEEAAVLEESNLISENHNQIWETALSQIGYEKRLLFQPNNEALKYVVDTLIELDIHSVEEELIAAAVVELSLKLEEEGEYVSNQLEDIERIRNQRKELEEYLERLEVSVSNISKENVNEMKEVMKMVNYKEEILNVKQQERLENMDKYRKSLNSGGFKKELEHESIVALHNKLMLEENELAKLGKEFGGTKFIPSSKVEARKIYNEKKLELAMLESEFNAKIDIRTGRIPLTNKSWSEQGL